MNRAEAQRVLLLYRPGTADTADPEMLEALELARHDPELEHWFQQHRLFQKAMASQFRHIEVPAHLRTSILAQAKAPNPLIPITRPGWAKPWWLAIAAVVLTACLLGLWLKPPPASNHFANFRDRMVRGALREYQMDIQTNDMRLVRQDLESRGAPADYKVPEKLGSLHLTGGGRLTWRTNPVAMVCFDRGDKKMLFLFVLKRSALRDPPPDKASLSKVKVNELMTASWTEGDETYLLAGPEDPDFLKKYF
jgi:hypothetical protein